MRSSVNFTLDLLMLKIDADKAPESKIETIKITIESSIKLNALGNFLGIFYKNNYNSNYGHNQSAEQVVKHYAKSSFKISVAIANDGWFFYVEESEKHKRKK